ncbi:hypothetical protein HN681_02140 [archaeon]|nr:hypothetical protein [archaeon]MBT3731376.1 hypothetical protein [archaeon]MBT4670321.1 hypothetical protein [archaeon]MBT5029661.1 hypothetical protein [archaeon]MBT7052421.1 hypothetical protein [archaeon]
MSIIDNFSFNANLGGMAGGKGLIGLYIAGKLKYARIPFKVLRPDNSVRNNEKPGLSSRMSSHFFEAELFDTKNASSILSLLEPHIELYLFEELHMVEDTAGLFGVLDDMIDARLSLNILALTNDTGARIFPIAAYCLSRGANIKQHYGVCQHSDLCRGKAVYSQLIAKDGTVVEDSGPIIASGDVLGSEEKKIEGEVDYQPRCRGHFNFEMPRSSTYQGGIFIPDPKRIPREQLPSWLLNRQKLVRERLDERIKNSHHHKDSFFAEYPSSHLIAELRQRGRHKVKTYIQGIRRR